MNKNEYDTLYKKVKYDFNWRDNTKNFNLKIDDDLKKYLMIRRERYLGIQYIFAFNNNFGLSIVKTPCTYGYYDDEWECAMLKYLDNLYKYELHYCDLTDNDLVGYMNDKQVNNLLRQVKEWSE